MKRIGIIGGGASGMFAAIQAAKEGADVTILESGERLGKKILSTGNGKCNLTNLFMDESCYYSENKPFVADALKRFTLEDTLQAFRSFGLMLRDRNGYVYPLCEQATVVSDILRLMLKEYGVKVITGFKASGVEKKGGLFRVNGEGKQSFSFERVILCTGGRAVPKTGSDGSGYTIAKSLGHGLVPVVPALALLICGEAYFKGVSGVRTYAKLDLIIDGKQASTEIGELQLTDSGISGIPVFQFSRLAAYALRGRQEVKVRIDARRDISADELYELVRVHRLLTGSCTAEEFFTGMQNKKLMLLFMKLADVKPSQELSELKEHQILRVCALCKCWEVTITGTNSFDAAQVCAGGVDTTMVSENMESKLLPGLYFAGELLDVDGKCGGYNLQWAWTSGAIAGRSAARR